MREPELYNERLNQLIRLVSEMDEHFDAPTQRRPQPARRSGTIAKALAAAAAVAFGFLPRTTPPNSSSPTHAGPTRVQIDYQPARIIRQAARIDAFEACSAEQAYASILLRVYDDDCQCVKWRLHRFDDGAALCVMRPGEMIEFTLDVSTAPPVEQVAMLVLAAQRDALPMTSSEVADLLACLNESLPPTAIGEQPTCCSAPAGDCLPPGVALVERPFVVE
ncbi:MAG: hypothetical protein D6744_03650 [Planctomycetota bacterium]|nr:MAG: hypothetical protein D6744_03650 [Planctomycetota bacterium]